MPGMEGQASSKVPEQEGGKVKFLWSVAAGSIDAGRPEGKSGECLACILAQSSPGRIEKKYSEAQA